MLSRRRFLQLSLASALASCTSSRDYSDADAERLTKQMADEAQRSGSGPFGKLRFEGYRGLATLPYFDLGEDGLLHAKIDLPPVFDFHAHLGWSYFLAPRVDLLRHAPRTEYLMDCDAVEPPCPLDLDVYVNANFTESMHRTLSWQTISSLLIGSRAAATHTIPNLMAEMRAAGVQRAAILPIATGLPLGKDPTVQVLDSIETANTGGRLVPFASVHPHDPNKRALLQQYRQRGVRGVKLHPEMQRFFPDEPGAMEIYEECGRLGLPVIFHAGRSGIEPQFMRPYALLRRYVAGIREFPKVRFVLGHSGARDVAEAIPLAQQYDNVWLELSSQGVTQIDQLLKQTGARKLLYGTDWPFYPLAVALAKVLIVTEGNAEARAAILGGNAAVVLGERH
jgi:hypothetical protein